MPDSMRYNDWFDKAKTELSSAKILLEHDGDNSVIAFLSQQVIEKILKGYILKNKEELIEGHSLIFLCKKSAEINNSIKDFMKDCAYVNQFYIETRYPADIPLDISNAEAKECIEIAQMILSKLIEI